MIQKCLLGGYYTVKGISLHTVHVILILRALHTQCGRLVVTRGGYIVFFILFSYEPITSH